MNAELTALMPKLRAKMAAAQAAQNQQLVGDTNLYRDQLQKSVYGGIGQQLNQGLSGINNWASTAGPLGDSGARAALQAKLAGNLYGNANNQIESGVSGLLGQLIQQRRQFDYQRQLAQYQKSLNQTGIGGIAGGIVGGIAGSALGPIGTAIGTKIGSHI